MDGENYIALHRELRGTINVGSPTYIVAFTAPFAYGSLRHFNLKAMEAHVDWISLISYDLYGVWDALNPDRNQVFCRTWI